MPFIATLLGIILVLLSNHFPVLQSLFIRHKQFFYTNHVDLCEPSLDGGKIISMGKKTYLLPPK